VARRVLGPFCRFEPGSEVADWTRHLGPLPAFLAAWAEREGIDFLDLTPALVASARSGAVPWFPADTHWNATGHAVAADAIASWQVVQGWLHTRHPTEVPGRATPEGAESGPHPSEGRK